jgi:hypothetical protein
LVRLRTLEDRVSAWRDPLTIVRDLPDMSAIARRVSQLEGLQASHAETVRRIDRFLADYQTFRTHAEAALRALPVDLAGTVGDLRRDIAGLHEPLTRIVALLSTAAR